MKTSLVFLLCLLAFSIRAQVRIGVQAGGQLATIQLATSSAGPANLNTTSRPGFHVGTYADFPLTGKISLRPQLLYSVKGYNGQSSADRVSLNYLHLPVEFLFWSNAGAGSLFIGAGGYFSNALSGKYRNENIRFGQTTQDDFRETDYGIRASVGYELEEGATVLFFYEYGLANVNPTPAYTLQNRVFGLTLQWALVP